MVSYSFPIIGDNITSNYKEVVNTFESGEWKNAIDEEMQSLHKNQTWDWYNFLKVRKRLGAKGSTQRKRNIQAKIMCSSRLLTNMLKWKGLNFSICIPLALIVQFASKLAQLDVKTTFLQFA